jgi:hypothetical protein
VEDVNPVSRSIRDSAVVQILNTQRRINKLRELRWVNVMAKAYLRLQDKSNELLAINPVKLSQNG